MNLVLLGPPGAGKGTQANLICEKYNLSHLSTGDLLRMEIANKSEVGVKAKQIIDEGKLVSNDIIINVIKSFFNNNKNLSGYLLDGFPRNTEQAKLLDKLMLELEDKISCVIQLDVEEKHLKERILSRGIEEGRSDDNEKTLLKKSCSIGANATIICGVTIGRYALIGAGAVVTKDIPDFALIIGNPGRLVGWVNKKGVKLNFDNLGKSVCKKFLMKEGLVFEV